MCAYRKVILTIGMQLHAVSLRTIWSISFPFGFINKYQSGIDFFNQLALNITQVL